MAIYDILYPYQRAAVDRIAEAKRILLADQPGLGKTLEVLGALEKLGRFEQPVNSLILTPIIAAQTAWKDTIENYVIPAHPTVQLIDLSKGSSAQKAKALEAIDPDRPTIILANHGAIEILKAPRVDGIHRLVLHGIVIDEAHQVLPILNDKKLTNFWKGLKHFDSVPVRIAVSGTPDRGKLENRYGTYRFLQPEYYRTINRWQWLEMHFFVYDKQVSRNRTVKAIGSLKQPARWNMDQELFMIRRTKNEVLQDLPPKQYRYIELEMHKTQLNQYQEAKANMVAMVEEAQERDAQTPAAMVFALRGRQISNCEWKDGKPVVGGKSAKLDWILEWLSERGYSNPDVESGSVVISSQFVEVLYWLKEELAIAGHRAEVIEGSLSSERRAEIQRDFQAGRLNIVLLSGRMGVGITLDVADDLILLDLPYDPDMLEQIEDRIHRASNMHQVTIWTLITVGTIEQLVAQTVARRYQATRFTMDGIRGVDFEKQVLSRLRVKMSEPSDTLQ